MEPYDADIASVFEENYNIAVAEMVIFQSGTLLFLFLNRCTRGKAWVFMVVLQCMLRLGLSVTAYRILEGLTSILAVNIRNISTLQDYTFHDCSDIFSRVDTGLPLRIQ